MMNDQSPAKPRKYDPEGQMLATIIGAIIWGALFARLGSMSNQLLLGSIGGMIVGAIIGFGFANGLVGPTAPCMSIFAFLGAFLGPACDYESLSSSLVGAGVGAFIGASGFPGILALVGALVGTNEGVFSGDMDAWLGLVTGGGIGWCLGQGAVMICRYIRGRSRGWGAQTDKGVGSGGGDG